MRGWASPLVPPYKHPGTSCASVWLCVCVCVCVCVCQCVCVRACLCAGLCHRKKRKIALHGAGPI